MAEVTERTFWQKYGLAILLLLIVVVCAAFVALIKYANDCSRNDLIKYGVINPDGSPHVGPPPGAKPHVLHQRRQLQYAHGQPVSN